MRARRSALVLFAVLAGLAIAGRAVFCSLFASSCRGQSAIEGNQRGLIEVHMLRRAEAVYHDKYGRYGDLAHLGPSGGDLIPKDVASGTSKNYEFRIEVTYDGYKLTAWPRGQGQTGYASYFCDETGIVRRGWGPAQATVLSPPVD